MKAKFVFEVGEANVKSYPFTKKHRFGEDDILYLFSTPSENYFVNFMDYENEDFLEYQVDFGITRGGYQYRTLNKGELFSVMTTVMDVIREFISEYNPHILHAIPKEDYESDARRYNLFKNYLSKSFGDSYTIHETIHPGTNSPAMVLVRKEK